MKTIYKYVLEKKHEQDLVLPKHSEILSVSDQFEDIVIYALVDGFEECTERYSIAVVGTGQHIGIVGNEKFLGTVKLNNGDIMLHVFYKLID